MAHVGEELALHATRALGQPSRLLEFGRLRAQLRDELPGETNRLDQTRAKSLGGPCRHRDVRVHGVEQQQLETSVGHETGRCSMKAR